MPVSDGLNEAAERKTQEDREAMVLIGMITGLREAYNLIRQSSGRRDALNRVVKAALDYSSGEKTVRVLEIPVEDLDLFRTDD